MSSHHWSENFHSAEELVSKAFPPTVPLIDGLLNAGEVGLLVGVPKVGKSRLVIQLAEALCNGRRFLGYKVTGKFRVLIADLENTPAMLQDRYNKMGVSITDQWYYYAPPTLCENALSLQGDGLKQLQAMLLEVHPDLLVIDTWRLLSGILDENRAGDITNALIELSRLRVDNPQMAILLVHHLRKQGVGRVHTSLRTDAHAWVQGVSGSHAIVGHTEFCWGLDSEIGRNGKEVMVFGGVARNHEVPSLLLEGEDNLRFRLAKSDSFESTLTDAQREIWTLAGSMGDSFHFNALVSKYGGNRKAVSAVLGKARDQGLLVQDAARVWHFAPDPAETQETLKPALKTQELSKK